MKILHLCSSDISGGAARAAYRLNMGLKRIGVESRMLVQDKRSGDLSVIGPKTNVQKGITILRKGLDPLPLSIYKNRQKIPWSCSWLPDNLYKTINNINPDIVNLHWLNNGFMNIKSLKKINAKIVWTIHDMWPFTGGCHYAGDCEKYKSHCKGCPQLRSNIDIDLSYLGFQKKKRVYSNLDLNIVILCKWMEQCIKDSVLLSGYNLTKIPNGLDTEVFKPIDKGIARDILNLPKDKKIILFGAMNSTGDKRKGFKYLKEALKILSERKKDVLLVIFGATYDKDIERLPFETRFLGNLNDEETLALAYSSANVFVAPSIEDNLPNTILESFACATPCVAFDIGGFLDLINHTENGYLAKHFSPESLASGIKYCLSKDNLGITAREKVEKEYNLETQANRYYKFYQSLFH